MIRMILKGRCIDSGRVTEEDGSSSLFADIVDETTKEEITVKVLLPEGTDLDDRVEEVSEWSTDGGIVTAPVIIENGEHACEIDRFIVEFP
jgi:hypothetical protein